MSVINDLADQLEPEIRKFLDDNPEGGTFILPNCDDRELAVALMVMTFLEEGWNVEYECEHNRESLEFKRMTFSEQDEFVHSE